MAFTKESSAQERSQALLQVERELKPGLSAVKSQILRALIQFAKKNLVGIDSHADSRLYKICNAIFTHVHLPDLFFLHHAIACLNQLKDDTSGLKKTILPMAQNYKRPLILPLVRQMEKASFSLSVIAFLMPDVILNLSTAAQFVTNELSAEKKIEKMLDLSLKSWPHSRPQFRKEEEFSDSIRWIFDLLHRSSKAAFGLFNNRESLMGMARTALPDSRYRFGI